MNTKTASNNIVMDGFLPEGQAKDLKDLDVDVDPLPIQHSLGLSRNVQSNSFTFCVSCEEKNIHQKR